MQIPTPQGSETVDAPPGRDAALLVRLGGVVAAVALVAWGVPAIPDPTLAASVGDVCILAATLLAVTGCLGAGRRGGPHALGWRWLAAAAGVWAVAQTLWTLHGLTGDRTHPFPSAADAGYVSYCLPAAVALLCFPRSRERLVSRLRLGLDALLVCLSVLFVSWATVLGPVYQAGGSGLSRVVGLAYPIVDVAIASLVLALGMRVPYGSRRPWLFLGTGLVVLACSDSLYVLRSLQGDTGVTGTTLAAGWVAAWLLVALASRIPVRPEPAGSRPHFSVGQELLLFLPLTAAAVVAAATDVVHSPFLIAIGVVLVLATIAQQVLIALEKVSLANDLEATVARRTAELTTAEDRFRSLVQSSDGAILSATPQGIVTSVNPAAEALYGYPEAELLGRPTSLLVPPDLLAQERANLERVGRGEQVRTYETERIRKDGRRLAVSVTTSPIFDRGVVNGVSAIAHDISERKEQEAELTAARVRALDASRAKSEFLATMSHEIRTPMNGVIGLTGLLLETPLDETQRRYAMGVRGAGEALLAIIDDILDFSKLEAGKVELEQVEFDPRQLVEEVGVLMAAGASAKGLELVAYCDPEVPTALQGDPGRLRQVLINLAGNAVKFTAEGEVAIRARVASQESGHVVLHLDVTDTGVGVDPALRARLFEPFAQADASTTRRFGGTGLGLAICRKLVEAMGGSIDVDSRLGAGSTFWFRVPLAVPGTVRRPVAPDVLTGLRALVVDDNETNRLILGKQLTAWQMRPDAAADGRTGLALLQQAAAQGEPYQLAILDLCMPEMDGLQLAGAIAADPLLAGTRVMILTSAGALDAQRASAAGVSAYLSKPVRHSELYNRLMSIATGWQEPTEDLVAAPAEDEPAPGQAPARRGRVLVVEDNRLNQMVAEGVLAAIGYDVDMAGDGLDALRRLDEATYDAVLMDCHMPLMDGFQATAEIRRREGPDRRTPVIAMTAGVLTEDRERCLAAGMDDFVPKPVDAALLEATLTRWTASAQPSPDAGADAAAGGGDAGAGVLDPARIAMLRGVGAQDGWGLLPALTANFLQEGSARLAALQAAVDAVQPHVLAEAAHSLKGMAGTIGAVQVAALCADLEALGRAGRTAPADALDRLGSELARAQDALVGMLPGPA